MATSYGGFLQNDRSALPPPLLPPWLSIASTAAAPQPPSVSLTLSPSSVRVPPEPPITIREKSPVSEIAECCRELEESRRAWAAHRNEAAWRVSRVEQQLESEKACRRQEKAEDTERKIEALRDEQRAAIDRIEAEYREQLAGLRKEAEAKERKLGEQWAAKHSRMTKFLEQMGCPNRPNKGSIS